MDISKWDIEDLDFGVFKKVEVVFCYFFWKIVGIFVLDREVGFLGLFLVLWVLGGKE